MTNVTIKMTDEQLGGLIDLLLKSHKVESDVYAEPLVRLLDDWGDLVARTGDIGHDYLALIEWRGLELLVEANNAWTKVGLPIDADCDYREALGLTAAAV